MSAIPHLQPIGGSSEQMLPLQREFLSVCKVDGEVMARAVNSARASGQTLVNVLLTMGAVTRADVCEAMHAAGHAPAINALAQMPAWDVIINEAENDKTVLAVTHQDDPRRRFFVVALKGLPDARTFSAIARASRDGYRHAGRIVVSPDFMDVLLADFAERQRQSGVRANGEGADASSLHADFDKLARAAYLMRASDIHITCREGRGEVALRIDGDLEHYQDWTEDYTIALVSATYNTLTETGSTRDGFSASQRLDGAIERDFPEGLVRFRFASTPISPSGFDVTLRIIPIGVQKQQQTMADLGYSLDQQDELDRMFAHSSGLIFFLGTTGSGKSTSMAVALEGVARAKPGKKIRTVEQPVEYRIAGTYQTSVARADFLPTISQMMRMDPDYLMIGETRDDETASAVLQAARSGHLCVSTLHADGAPLAFDRLQGLGVARNELASVGLVVGIVYQKLVQLVCPDCKQPASRMAAEGADDAPILRRVRRVNGGTLDGIYFARPGGCPKCRGRGVRGRTVCAEILRPTVRMLSGIASGDSREIWRQWRSMIDTGNPARMRGRTAFEHAIWKMRQGIVSPVSVEAEFRLLDEPPFEDYE